MKTYIKQNIFGYYIEFLEEIDAEYWEGKIGTTYEDFLENKWILLNDEQVKFHKDHPDASVAEVFNMELQLPKTRTMSTEESLEIAKQELLMQIDSFDRGKSVNSFIVNNKDYEWFTQYERANYKNSIDSAKLLGIKTVSFYIGDKLYTISTNQAEQMLASIQLYADACYIVTKKHQLAVKTLQTIEEVKSYDYTADYPEKLNFVL